jgi:hypothetical protein
MVRKKNNLKGFQTEPIHQNYVKRRDAARNLFQQTVDKYIVVRSTE